MILIAKGARLDRRHVEQHCCWTLAALTIACVRLPSLSRFSSIAWLTITITATTVAACGGGDGRGAGSLSIDDLPAAYKAATCKVWILCRATPDLETCEATLSPAGSAEILTIVEAVKRGTTLYDGSAMRACLDALSRSCWGRTSPLPACEQALQGQLPTGSACVASEECAGGGFCDKSCAGDMCCTGTCAPRVAVGGACDGARCRPGTYCKQGVCAEYLPLGAPCTASNECASPGFCEIAADASSGTCALPDPAGSPCNPGRPYPCGGIDQRCDPTVNRCVETASVGAACTEDRDCVLYARCVEGVCTALPTVGAACATNSNVPCQGMLECSSGTCAARAAQSACVPAK